MHDPSRRGLTMLEVLVATVILVAVVTMVFVIMTSASNRSATETANLALQEKATRLLDEISIELRMAKADTIKPLGAPPVPILNTTFLDSTNNNAVTPIHPLSGPIFDQTVPANAKCPLNSVLPNPATPRGKVTPGYKRYDGITFRTQSTAAMENKAGVSVPVNDFDFTAKKPAYSRTVVYQTAVQPANFEGGPTEEAPAFSNGIDNNQNTLIDERVLTKQEYKNNPPPPSPPDPGVIARNLRGIAFELPDAPAVPERVILHVMLQDVDAKGKLIWYYATTTVTTRN